MKKIQNLLGPYKGYFGSYEISNEDEVFHGKIEFIRDLIIYEGNTVRKLNKAFEDAVDDYLATCLQEKREPDRPFKGAFNVRVGEEIHRKACILASKQNKSLNEFTMNALQDAIERSLKSHYITK